MNTTDSRSSLLQALQKLKSAGLGTGSVTPTATKSSSDLVKQVAKLFHPAPNKKFGMLFFVMYDITDTKVRTLVAKYLIKKGCVRIQKSIFLANLTPDVFQIIQKDLKEVQSCYENEDSILLIPVPADFLNSMKVIGRELNTDLITGQADILFF